MEKRAVTSLRRFRAQRCFDGYVSLPTSQRTDARSAMLIGAIFEYAYDHVPRSQVMSSRQIRVSPEDAQRISQRLEEFMPRPTAKDGEPIMNWLHENLIPEAWAYPEDMRHLMRDILREW